MLQPLRQTLAVHIERERSSGIQCCSSSPFCSYINSPTVRHAVVTTDARTLSGNTSVWTGISGGIGDDREKQRKKALNINQLLIFCEMRNSTTVWMLNACQYRLQFPPNKVLHAKMRAAVRCGSPRGRFPQRWSLCSLMDQMQEVSPSLREVMICGGEKSADIQ